MSGYIETMDSISEWFLNPHSFGNMDIAACPSVLLQREPKRPGQSRAAKNPPEIWDVWDLRLHIWKYVPQHILHLAFGIPSLQNWSRVSRFLKAQQKQKAQQKHKAQQKQSHHPPKIELYGHFFSPPFSELPLAVTFYWGKLAEIQKRCIMISRF